MQGGFAVLRRVIRVGKRVVGVGDGKRVGALKCSRYSSVVYEGVGIEVDGNLSGVSAVPCVIRFYRSRIVLLPLPLGSHASPTACLCVVARIALEFFFKWVKSRGKKVEQQASS